MLEITPKENLRNDLMPPIFIATVNSLPLDIENDQLSRLLTINTNLTVGVRIRTSRGYLSPIHVVQHIAIRVGISWMNKSITAVVFLLALVIAIGILSCWRLRCIQFEASSHSLVIKWSNTRHDCGSIRMDQLLDTIDIKSLTDLQDPIDKTH